MKILIYIEDNDNKINSNSLESLKAAQEIKANKSGQVYAVTFNDIIANELTRYDLDKIYSFKNSNLDDYSPLFFIKAMENMIEEIKPDIIIFGHTYQTRDWVPRLSARLDIPFISDCTGIKIEDDLKFVRQLYQGKVTADFTVSSFPLILSFQSGSFRADQISNGSSEVNSSNIDFNDVVNTIHPDEKFQESESEVDLTQADIIVSIGRGIGKEDNLPMVNELAEKLGGNVASSRPIVDSGWLEPYHQIGSSGQTVSPKLYIALGMSGAIQHVVGMKGSQNIVVINKDSNAPFFELADYAVVGDILEIIPKMIEVLDS
ncbi:MAG: electron transfer flavoprotein subunit alpha [Candidatus Marinimicrobia bacterium]|nr:electron transfer flavoprotein subunit alpha [Candidatus Neomarinimicrobiota bacterium]